MSVELCQYWMCEPRSLRLFMEKINTVSIDQLKQMEGSESDKVNSNAIPSLSIESGVAVIPVQGILMQRVPDWLDYWIKKGYVNITSLEVIRLQVQAAAEDPMVKEIRLRVHSPGGTVAGTMEAAEAIAEARTIKPVIAEVESMSASGGYYLSSQANRIESNADAEIGSIGVFAVYYDWSKMYEEAGVKAVVISSGEHKGAGVIGAPITEAQIKAVRDVIDDMAGHFIAAVASGRGMNKTEVKALADGRMWLAPRAKKVGLIDTIQNKTFFKTKERDTDMSDQDIEKKAQDQAVEQAKAAGESGAIDRMKRLKEAFADDPTFAMDQFVKGNTVAQAKAEYCDILAKHLQQATNENQQLKEKLEKTNSTKTSTRDTASHEPDPIPYGSSDGADGGEDTFKDYVTQYMKEGLSRAKAITKAVRMHPKAHEEHLHKNTVGVR